MTTQQRLQMLQTNAPLVYPSVVQKRRDFINTRLADLRIKYQRSEQVEEKQRITEEAKELKEELNIYE